MKQKRSSLVLAFLLMALLPLCLFGCMNMKCHKKVYQNGKLLGEWDTQGDVGTVLRSFFTHEPAFSTRDGRQIITLVAPGIRLDTVQVRGGMAIVEVEVSSF